MKKLKYHFAVLLHMIFPKLRKYYDLWEYNLNIEYDIFEPGGYLISANKWGLFKLKRKPERLQVAIAKDGWIVNTPTKNHGVLAYPKVKLPTNTKYLKYDVDLEVEKNKKYNLSLDIFLGYENKSNFWAGVTHEIMVWEQHHIAKPEGKKTKSTGDYDVYEGYVSKKKEPHLGTPGWKIITFVKKRDIPGRIIHIEHILDYLNLPNDPLAIDFGTEVYNANLKMVIHDLEVEM